MPSDVSTSANAEPPLWMTPVSFAFATVERSEPRRDSSDSNGSRRPAGSYFGADGARAAAAVVAATVPGDGVVAFGAASFVAACRAFTAAVAADAAAFAASIVPFGSATGDAAGFGAGGAAVG